MRTGKPYGRRREGTRGGHVEGKSHDHRRRIVDSSVGRFETVKVRGSVQARGEDGVEILEGGGGTEFLPLGVVHICI